MCGIWIVGVAPMNFKLALDQVERQQQLVFPAKSAERRDLSVFYLMSKNSQYISASYSLERPLLPTPKQVMGEIWKTTGEMALSGKAWSKRSLIYHTWVTLKSTLFGFILGAIIGMCGAISIVYFRVADLTLMPWAIISQTVPIVALAPMIIVLSSQIGIENRDVPKAVISAYLCFFPVMVGMVKGLRSPDHEQLDLLKTYNATAIETFFKLRLEASIPYLFTSLKVGIALALVGTIVGELPTGAINGLGARILIGDQYGTPLVIWAALFLAALLAGVLVTSIGFLQKVTLRKMGMLG
jgi:NitT/TauT family transport system permease protein